MIIELLEREKSHEENMEKLAKLEEEIGDIMTKMEMEEYLLPNKIIELNEQLRKGQHSKI